MMVKWFRKAAELGEPDGIKNLIYCLKSAIGLRKPYPNEAAQWQQKLDEIEKAEKP